MPNYRCPICGANHKKMVPNCRLCGQNMSGEFIPTGPPPSAGATTAMVGNKGGTKGIFFIGAAVVLVLALAGIAFGVVRSNSAVEAVKSIGVTPVDGWTPQSEPDEKQGTPASTASSEVGHFVVELPGDRVHEEVPFTATKSGKLSVWTAKVGKGTKMQVGWGKVTPPAPGPGTNGGTAVDQSATIRNYLKQLALDWAAQNNLTDDPGCATTTAGCSYKTAEISVGGYPGFQLNSIGPRFKLDNQDAFGWLGLTLKGDTLYVIQVYSIYGDAPQFTRVANTFTITG
jgi:hypothetical protein